MKIDDPIKKAQGPGLPSRPVAGGRAGSAPTAAATGQDSVSLSAQARSLAGQSGADGVFDAGKVEQIKSAIASGQFQVHSEKVADGLIESVRDLIRQGKG
ncbi:MAG: flagellar biosynthesis anti-sigma factor FlgM [Noviherbaspirillum sp.]